MGDWVGAYIDGPCRFLNRQYTGIFSLKYRYCRHFKLKIPVYCLFNTCDILSAYFYCAECSDATVYCPSVFPSVMDMLSCYKDKDQQESRAVAQKAHDAVVKSDTYRNLQRHRAVLPAIARHLVSLSRQQAALPGIWRRFYFGRREVNDGQP